MNILPLCEFFFPVAEHPFWGVRINRIQPPPRPGRVQRVTANGKIVRQFYLTQSGRICPWNDLKSDGQWELLLRVPWRSGEPVRVTVEADGGEEWQGVVGTAPSPGGYEDRWGPYFSSLVLTEEAGLDRHGEPVHLSMNFFADQIRSDCADLCVLAVDPSDGSLQPALWQVLETAEWNDAELVAHEPYRYQPTRTVDLLLVADVPARQRRVFLVFHGSGQSHGAARETDLSIRRSDSGLTVENRFYCVALHGPSGMIDDIRIKQGRDIRLHHHHEREGTVHWNPDIWSPPRPWVHTNDWPDASKDYIEGPLCFVAKSYGVMPDGVDEVEMSVTYQFYASSPVILMSSATHVKRPISVKSLRNGEIVFNREVIDHVAWSDGSGGHCRSHVDDLPPHPKPHEGPHVPPDAPWLCLYSPSAGVALGQLNISRLEYRWAGGLPRIADAHYYVAVGPWIYIARALIYPWGTNNPSLTAVVPGGSYYLERVAWLPLAVEKGPSTDLSALDAWSRKLARPLVPQIHSDVDVRTPERFVNPCIRFAIEQTDSDNVYPEADPPIIRRQPLDRQ